MARTRPAPREVPPIEGPVRTCVGCRSRGPVSELLRVVAVDGSCEPDPRRREPGRGAWVHPDPDCLHRAERRSAFPRALRAPGPLDTGALRAFLAGRSATDRPRAPGPDDRRGRRTRKQVDPHEPAVKHSR